MRTGSDGFYQCTHHTSTRHLFRQCIIHKVEIFGKNAKNSHSWNDINITVL